MTSEYKERASAEVTARVGNLGLDLGCFSWSAHERERYSNVFSRRAGLSCKRLNFAGYDRKFLTVVTHLCCFNRRVQCEQIGLARHFL